MADSDYPFIFPPEEGHNVGLGGPVNIKWTTDANDGSIILYLWQETVDQ
jgi:hypothetical protein